MGTNRPVLLVLLLSLGSCVQSDPPEAPEDEVGLTFNRLIEDMLPDPETSIEVEVTEGGDTVFSEVYPVTFEGSDYVANLGNLQVAAASYDIRASVLPAGESCSVEVDLSSGVDMTVGVLIRNGCSLVLEETEGWSDTTGAEVSEDVIQEFHGGAHCGWETVRFIAFGRYFEGDAYLRDVDGVFAPELFVSHSARQRLDLDEDETARAALLEKGDYLSLDLETELPDDAASLGYHRGIRELFTSPADDGDYVYMVSPEGTERWPRVQPHPACA